MNTQKKGGEMWYTEQKNQNQSAGSKIQVPKLNSMLDADTYAGMFKIPAQLVFGSGASVCLVAF